MQFFTILLAIATVTTSVRCTPTDPISDSHAVPARKPELQQDVDEYKTGPDVPYMPAIVNLPPNSKLSEPIRPQNLPYFVAEVGGGTTQVGELTGNSLYNATSSALQNLCPRSDGGCDKNRKFVIPGIKYKDPNELMMNSGSIDITVEAQLDRLPQDRLKSDFIHIIASVISKQSDNKKRCERIETPCHSHECLPSMSVLTLLCNTSDSVEVHLENVPAPVRMTASFVFRRGMNSTVLPVLP